MRLFSGGSNMESRTEKQDARPKSPGAVKIVAVYFLLCGVIGCARVVSEGLAGKFEVALTAPGVLVGLGLFGLSRTWRFIGVLMLGIAIGASPVVVLSPLVGAPEIHWSKLQFPIASFGLTFADRVSCGFWWPLLGLPSPGLGPVEPVAGLALWCFLVWQLRVLTRPQTRAVFARTWPASRW